MPLAVPIATVSLLLMLLVAALAATGQSDVDAKIVRALWLLVAGAAIASVLGVGAWIRAFRSDRARRRRLIEFRHDWNARYFTDRKQLSVDAFFDVFLPGALSAYGIAEAADGLSLPLDLKPPLMIASRWSMQAQKLDYVLPDEISHLTITVAAQHMLDSVVQRKVNRPGFSGDSVH